MKAQDIARVEMRLHDRNARLHQMFQAVRQPARAPRPQGLIEFRTGKWVGYTELVYAPIQLTQGSRSLTALYSRWSPVQTSQ